MSSRRPRTLSEYLRAARFRKLLIITTALVFAAAAWLALRRQPNLYEASAVITMESGSGEAADASRRISALQQQLASPARLEALAALPSNIRLSEGGPNSLRLGYRATEPATAAKVANGLAEGIVADHTKSAGPPAESEALRQRALELSARLREMEDKSPWLLALKDVAPVAAAPRG